MGGPVEEVRDGSLHRSWTCWMVVLGPLYVRVEMEVVEIVVRMSLPSTEMRVLKGRSNVVDT